MKKRFSAIYIALILLFLFAPIAVLVVFSFNSGDGVFVFEGFAFDFRWYKELFKNEQILDALKNSLILAVCSAAVSTVVGTAAAFGIYHMKKKWAKNAVLSATNIPMMNPDIITGISLMFLFVFVGGLIGLQTKLNFWTMLIAHITFSLPYVILNVLPKFRQMDKSLPEAALDLGCTPMQSFFKVQLPCILPGVFTGMIMAFTMSLDDFVISYFTSGVDFQTLPVLIYSMTKKTVKPTIYALSTLIFIVVLVMLIITNLSKSSEERLEAKRKREEKKRKEAILRAQKTGKPVKVKKTSESKPPRHTKPVNFTKIIAAVCILAVLATVVTALCIPSKETLILNVYNWGEYISDGSDESYDTNREFEIYAENYYKEQLGKDVTVRVNYVTYSSNEDMYAKLSSGAVSFDVIIPSDYMIARLKDGGFLRKINFDNIPNYETSIDDDFKGLYYDPTNEYSVPYTYGMVGVIYDANKVDEEDVADESWDLMWNEKYSGQIVQFNNSRDAFGTAFYKLGLDVNTTDKADWDKGLEELRKQKPLLKKLVMDEIYNMMESGEAAIGSYYAGDYLTMVDNQAEGVDLGFYYPDNTNLFVDAMCIPECTQNQELAEMYINFMLSDDAAIANAEYICYASPHKNVYDPKNPNREEDYAGYIEDMGEEAIEILYPEDFDFAEAYDKNCYKDLTAETKAYINDLWGRYATGSSDEEGYSILTFDLVVIAVILAATVTVVLVSKRKRKR